MPLADLTLAELERYAPPRDEPDDFDAFWDRTLREAREHPMRPRFDPVAIGLRAVDALDVTFPGFGGDPIKGWLLLPAGAAGSGVRLPCVVSYIGYGGGRSQPFDWLLWASFGMANLVMDTSGQGGGWSAGSTTDRSAGPIDPQNPGFMTRGVLSPETWFYRRLVTDAVRAVEAARAHPAVDPERVAVCGASQGGGIALAAAGLTGGLAAALVDVPFLCHWRRAMDVAGDGPYLELVRYCAVQRANVERVLGTLAYVDGVNFAARASASALFSVALMDSVCPPSTVYAAHHHYAGPKRITVWPYNEHEGGETHQVIQQIAFLREVFGP
jgi:cephalosporin-C deacetylase